MPYEDREDPHDDPLAHPDRLLTEDLAPGVARRRFPMRGAVLGSTAVLTGRAISAQENTPRSTAAPRRSSPI